MGGLTLPLIGTAVGMWGSYEKSKAEKEAARKIERSYQPFEEYQREMLPQLRQLILERIGAANEGVSPFSKELFAQRRRDIRRGTGKMLAESQVFWSRRGMQGRGRGEAMRIQRSGEEAMGAEAIAQAEYIETQRLQNLGIAYDALLRSLSLTAGITQPAISEAAKYRTQAKDSLWSGLGGGLGYLSGQIGQIPTGMMLNQADEVTAAGNQYWG